MNVVLDTNILISACWKPDGLEARTVDLAIQGSFQPCITPEVWAEYREVLCRDKFLNIQERAVTLLHLLEDRAFMVQSSYSVHVASDEDDNRFLECAAAARAHYLVTGNLRHYPVVWETTAIVNARQFLSSCFANILSYVSRWP